MEMKKEFTEDVQVIMPKFKVKTDMEISDWLKDAGVKKIFEGKRNTNSPILMILNCCRG